jgi:hypothetical protein
MAVNTRAMRYFKVVGYIFVTLFVSSGLGTAHAASTEEETGKWLATIRAIKPEGGRDSTDRYNKQLDDAWKFFTANKATVLPILRRELSAELRKEHPNQMLLLDIGYFIRLQEDRSDKDLGRQAFFAIDSSAEVVRWNGQQLFQFAHAVVPDKDPRTLPALDRVFLRGNVTAFIPQHALSLDETLVCVFLYGVYGQGAEGHLRSQLADRSVAQRVIEILIWIGSPESVPEVTAAMMASREYEIFARGTAFMMSAGGPKGRTTLLSLPIESFDAKSQQYFGRVRRDIEATTYEVLQRQFKSFPNPGRVSDAELKTRLSAMYRNYGKDDTTNPQAFLVSGLPNAYLVPELSRIRGRMFFRVSDEALSDVKLTNALLNTLYYKQQ